MTEYGSFAVEKCGNADEYFIFDAFMSDKIRENIWTKDGHGYVCRNRNGVMQRLHIMVAERMIGSKIPKGCYVDHINRCKLDNRTCNLRVVSPEDSARNMPIKANNTSGVTGVSITKYGTYRAYISVDKRRIELGYYPTLQEAARIRYAAEETYGFKHQQNLSVYLNELEDTK